MMTGEEDFIILQNSTLVEGDVRTYLTKRENETLLEVWRKKKTQGRLIRRFPRQIAQLLRREVWRWAIKHMDGRAWIFFILAICDWPRQILDCINMMEEA